MSNDGAGPQRAEATELSVEPGTEMQFGADAPLTHVMATMRAMRKLKPDPVPRELLTELVRAATWAPSGSDAQHYAFIVVDDRELMAELAELWRDCFDTYQAISGTIVPGNDSDRHRRMYAALDYQAAHFHETQRSLPPSTRSRPPTDSTSAPTSNSAGASEPDEPADWRDRSPQDLSARRRASTRHARICCSPPERTAWRRHSPSGICSAPPTGTPHSTCPRARGSTP